MNAIAQNNQRANPQVSPPVANHASPVASPHHTRETWRIGHHPNQRTREVVKLDEAVTEAVSEILEKEKLAIDFMESRQGIQFVRYLDDNAGRTSVCMRIFSPRRFLCTLVEATKNEGGSFSYLAYDEFGQVIPEHDRKTPVWKILVQHESDPQR